MIQRWNLKRFCTFSILIWKTNDRIKKNTKGWNANNLCAEWKERKHWIPSTWTIKQVVCDINVSEIWLRAMEEWNVFMKLINRCDDKLTLSLLFCNRNRDFWRPPFVVVVLLPYRLSLLALQSFSKLGH